MGEILEALYEGRLKAEPIIEKRSIRYQKACDTTYTLLEELSGRLNPEDRELLDKVIESLNSENYCYVSGSYPRRLRNWTPLPGCRSCAISSRQASPLLCHSIWSREQSAAMISRTGSARTAWNFTQTFSNPTSDGAGCCIYRIMPALSRMISSWSCASWTAA